LFSKNEAYSSPATHVIRPRPAKPTLHHPARISLTTLKLYVSPAILRCSAARRIILESRWNYSCRRSRRRPPRSCNSHKAETEFSSWVADAVAALAGWSVVVLIIGLIVGNASDLPTVLYKDAAWKSGLQFLWYHPHVMLILGSFAGVAVLCVLRVIVGRASTSSQHQVD
jgi:hypothetical protein